MQPTVLASSLIESDALWKITLASLVRGAGAVIAIGLLLPGLS